MLTGRCKQDFETRQEATKSAIEKANELYNEKCDKECSQ